MAVPRIFVGGGGGGGQTPRTPHRGLPYTDRISSWTFFVFFFTPTNIVIIYYGINT